MLRPANGKGWEEANSATDRAAVGSILACPWIRTIFPYRFDRSNNDRAVCWICPGPSTGLRKYTFHNLIRI